MGRSARALTLISIVAVVVFGTCATFSSAADTPAKLGYNRDIRPLLSDNCFACHGPDKNKRKAKLRLDDRASALEIEAFVPGKPDQSELIKRIFSTDPKEKMPPPESNKKLTDAQRLLLKTWIEQGAEYEPHWAYIAPKRPAVPPVSDAARVKNPLDAFILRALEDRKITPAPQADRRTLLRRLSLDLTGLPPSPAEMQSFLDDKSPDAYEKQVDRLLFSPHYGERMAVPWLDYVRFADTVGFHGDQNINVFPYRDYVIDAFNHNKPFDQFTIEQLAGDLLPHPTTEQLIATAFNRLNMVTREGGAQPGEYLAKYMADRVRTVGSTFLGSTMNCCECHDHKYDPFSAKDFYSMGAFFADVKQWGVYMDYAYTPNKDLIGWSNDSPFPPELIVDSPYLKRRQASLFRQIDQIADRSFHASGDTGHEAFSHWQSQANAFLAKHPDGWAVVSPVGLQANQNTPPDTQPVATLSSDNAVLFKSVTPAPMASKRAVATDRIAFALPEGNLAAIRLELLPHESHHGSIARDGSSNASVQISLALRSQSGIEKKLPVYFADADLKDERFANGYPLIGVKDAWKTSSANSHGIQTAVYILDTPLAVSRTDQLVVSINKNGPGCIRVSTSPIASLAPFDASTIDALKDTLATRPEDQPSARLAYLLSTHVDSASVTQIRKLYKEVLECRDGKSPVLVTMSVAAPITRVLHRGNWQDQTGAIVDPAVPHFLPQPNVPKDRRLTRLDLARWIVSPENPLTSRVYVNRLWKQFFGSGLSNIVEDLGAQGESPTHPELLDYLAVEFRQNGWDVKHIVRLIVTSSTYKQDSNLPLALRDSDPGNRLYSAQSPRRLEAEFIRDNALSAAGLIDLDIGGPSAKPYQPEGYYANIQFPDRKYVPDPDARQWRRGLYMHWQRTFLHPMLANFDAPSREDPICTRNLSNTPQQALTLLNDPEFIEAARVLAQNILASDAHDDPARITQAYQRALGRPPHSKELVSLTDFLSTQREYFLAHRDDANKLIRTGFAPVALSFDVAELAAYTSLCRVVLNLHETITRY
ncbi:MAG TPA: PSD1 and planctomycete cytochrome C domain-containing protein [Tepidisphaeraceae bacterium]